MGCEKRPGMGFCVKISVANELALANEAAIARGVDPEKSLVTITEETTPPGVLWRINYGPREYFRKRGGDLILIVDSGTQTVQRILRGQ
jgi:hypothetical protein